MLVTNVLQLQMYMHSDKTLIREDPASCPWLYFNFGTY